MGWRSGAYCKVWNVQDKGSYSVASITISGKVNKDSNEYETKFRNGFVRLVGSAHEMAKQIEVDQNGKVVSQNGVTIRISENGCDHTTPRVKAAPGGIRPSSAIGEYKDKNNDTWYTYANYTIFGFEFPDDVNGANSAPANNMPTPAPTMQMDTSEEDLPF